MLASSPAKGLSPALTLGYLGGYVLLDWLSFSNELAPIGVTPWNPPPGLSLALIIIFGVRAAPLLFVAALLADLLVRNVPFTAWTVAAECAIAVCYSLSGLALRGLSIRPSLDRQRDVSWFLAVSMAASFAASLSISSIFVAGNVIDPGLFWTATFRFWVGDAVGIAVTAPLILRFVGGELKFSRFTPRLETLAQAAAMAVALWAVFRFDLTSEFRVLYPLFIPLVWIAVRHGLDGAVIGAAAMQVGLTLVSGLGSHDADKVTQLQFGMLAFTATSLLVAVVVSERRRADETVRTNEQRLRSLFALAPVGIAEIGAGGVIRSANPMLAQMAGTTAHDLAGRRADELVPSVDLSRPTPPCEVGLNAPHTPRWIEVSVAETGVSGERIAVVQDISERKELERRKRAHQVEVDRVARINAAGELAAALAHELNQPLGSIAYYTRAAQRLMKLDEGAADAEEAMDKAVAQAVRAGDIIRNLRNFLSRGEAIAESLDLRTVITGVCDLLGTEIKAGRVNLALDLAQPLAVMVDRVQLEQVFVNLIRNAVDAMAGTQAPHTLAIAGRAAEGVVSVEVIDTGPGLAPEIAADLFRPFTTTKPGGMGLGLSICASLVEAAGGSLSLKTTGPGGATFLLTLPHRPASP